MKKEKCSECGGELTLSLIDMESSSVILPYCENCFPKKGEVNKGSEDLKVFVDSLRIAYREFCLNKAMHEKIGTELYNNIHYKKVWDTVLKSLEGNYKRWLATIVEQPPNFLKIDKEYESITKKLLELRKKYFGHYDEEFLRNPILLNKIFLEDKEINDLFDRMIKIVKEYNNKSGILLPDVENLEDDISDNGEKWLDEFKK